MTVPNTPAPQSYAYGRHADQWAQLHLPAEATHRGVVVVIHGGYWRSTYGAELGDPLARDLAAHGIAAWNLEYRRAGNGGGWPETFQDVADGIDALASAAAEHGLDLEHVVALGHSAGGHLAVWAAGRAQLPDGAPGAHPAVELSGVVSQSGLLDLAEAARLGLSNHAVANLLGAARDVEPGRYALADPMAAVPLSVPVYAVQAEHDDDVPPTQSRVYVDAARAAGAEAHLVMVPGDHYGLIDVRHRAYRSCRDLVAGLLPAVG
ncbi:alpha/beta hydrolase family protein [Arthrobacter sp. 35W]|uniref:alpha/beta hydrolase family protein n=1 Tax=Arthrobacter sp. 35W TaxID=1132441 RepID=UPI0004002DBA|nr:alpha/beta hydrolase [Arthrobacter sp. 35W]